MWCWRKSVAEAESVLDDCLHMVSAEIEKKHQTLTISKDIIYPYISYGYLPFYGNHSEFNQQCD